MKGFRNGVNLGGWISQFDRDDEAHFASFITRGDIAKIAADGYDHVRVPVDYVMLEGEDGAPRDTAFFYLDQCLSWCREFHLNMLIDLHECYGYSFDPLKKEIDRRHFFYDAALQERFLKLWERIAEHFAPAADMIAFEPLNEVVPADVADAWNDLLGRYIARMRRIVPRSYLVLGGVCYNNVTSVPLIHVPPDPYLVYNFHCYEPLVFTHQGAYWVDRMPSDFRIGYPRPLEEYRRASAILPREAAGAIYREGIRESGEGYFEDLFAPAVKKAVSDGAGLYCGEYGVIALADPQDKARWLRDISAVFDKYDIGRALWNYKGKDFGPDEIDVSGFENAQKG